MYKLKKSTLRAMIEEQKLSLLSEDNKIQKGLIKNYILMLENDIHFAQD